MFFERDDSMSSYKTGLISKSIFATKSTIAYNILWILVILIVIFAVIMTVMSYVSDNDYYETVEIYSKYENNYLYFNNLKFELPEKSTQQIKVDTLLETVPENTEVQLKVAKKSNKLLEVQYSGTVVYRGTITTKASVIIASALCLVAVSFSVLMLVATNIKNPKGKFIKKLWRSLYYNR